MSQPSRALSLRQASNCENARHPVCRCRCGGALHGAARGDGVAFFDGLNPHDPHFIPSPERTKQERLEAAITRAKLIAEADASALELFR